MTPLWSLLMQSRGFIHLGEETSIATFPVLPPLLPSRYAPLGLAPQPGSPGAPASAYPRFITSPQPCVA